MSESTMKSFTHINTLRMKTDSDEIDKEILYLLLSPSVESYVRNTTSSILSSTQRNDIYFDIFTSMEVNSDFYMIVSHSKSSRDSIR